MSARGFIERLRALFVTAGPTFFDRFAGHAAITAEAGRQLAAMIGDLEHAQEHADRIKKLEHDADDLTHATVEAIHRTFVAPIERDDIQRVISRLDDVVDFIEAVAQRLYLFEIRRARPEATAMVRVLVEATEAIGTIVEAFRVRAQWPSIRAACVEVGRLEHSCDDALREATVHLFKEERDVGVILKWKEIFDNIENAVDRCADVANVIEGVVIENL